jgi:hypothetical protein
MKLKLWLFLLTFCMVIIQNVKGQKLSSVADSLYTSKNFSGAAVLYNRAGSLSEFRATRATNYYNAACCYALLGNKDSAYFFLEKAKEMGMTNKKQVMNDADLVSLHNDKKYKRFIKGMKQKKVWTSDPQKAQIITTDIDHFWDAYDRAQKDTARRLEIYREFYIDKGTIGLQDYFALKVGNMKSFIRGHDHHAKFYAGIRANTMQIEKQKPMMMKSFVQFKEIYPAAKFPPVYFVIGNFTSGGTVSQNGLLIGTEQKAKSPDVPLDELSLWEKNIISDINTLPYVIAHELIHFNQQMASDTTLLATSLREGMADFIGSLISGKSSNERLHTWAKGKEKMIFSDFKKEMWLNRGGNWVGNAMQETPEHPADLGYWVGYMICKGYYDHAANKKQAVADMLNIQDYKKFYEASHVEEMLD